MPTRQIAASALLAAELAGAISHVAHPVACGTLRVPGSEMRANAPEKAFGFRHRIAFNGQPIDENDPPPVHHFRTQGREVGIERRVRKIGRPDRIETAMLRPDFFHQCADNGALPTSSFRTCRYPAPRDLMSFAVG